MYNCLRKRISLKMRKMRSKRNILAGRIAQTIAATWLGDDQCLRGVSGRAADQENGLQNAATALFSKRASRNDCFF